MMKLNKIVKILCTGLMPLPNTHRGRIDAGLFVREDYIFLYTAPTPPIFIVWKERMLLFVASFFITFKIT